MLFFANGQNRGPIFNWRWLFFVTWIFEPMGWNLHFDLLIDDRAWIVELIPDSVEWGLGLHVYTFRI